MKRIRRLFHRRSLDRELAGEIAAHIEEKADELMESGMPREDALRAARSQFGNGTAVHEQSRDIWSFVFIESMLRDLRIGARSLRRSPLFVVVATLTLALGIGANTAIFSLIDAILLRPLPFPDAARITVLWEVPPQRSAASAQPVSRQNPVSPANFSDWRKRTHSFQAMAAVSTFPMGLSGFGAPREVVTLQVSAAFFQILGIAPLLGRTFTAGEDVANGPRVAVLSYALWQQQFGGDRSVLGRTIQLLDEPYKVLGVMPEGFDLPFQHAELWTPIQDVSSEGRYLSVIAKLKPGMNIAQAETDLVAVENQIGRERPYVNSGWSASVVSLYRQTTGEVSTALLLLFGAVTSVLLIAVANVANLLLMRGTQRKRELAVRAALGASRTRIATQLLAESFLLSLIGGVAAIAIAVLGVRTIVKSLPAATLPRLEGVHVDAGVLLFTAALCLIATFLFGLAPALTFSRASPDDALKQGSLRTSGSGSRRLRGLLVIIEVALSLVLLVGAGLLGRSFLAVSSVSPGFRVDRILTMSMFFAPARYAQDDRRAQYLGDILARVRALPGVEAASSAHFLAMTGNVSGSGFRRLDRPEPAPGTQPDSDYLIVSPQYFRVMGIPLLAGRDFNEQDRMGREPGIIINESLARKFFPGENPLGKRLGLDWNIKQGEIIGIASDNRQTRLTVAPQPTIFLNHAQTPMYFGSLVVRTALPAMLVARSVEQAVHAVDADQAISHVESMQQVIHGSLGRPRLESVLLGIFAAIALTLAVIGLYGVLAYSVTQRTREIGIRMALGADSSLLVRDFIREGLQLMLPGMAAGILASLALTRLLGSLLYNVKPTDPLTLALVSALMLVVGIFASWIPARRAARVDPLGSLRWE